MPKLIIICGLSGSGKTTLARVLSNKLQIARLHKDSFKERLYELLQLSSLEDSRRLGGVSAQLLLHIAEEQLASGVNLIIEAPFTFDADIALFRRWVSDYQLDTYTVVCTAPETILHKRFTSRPRHPAHHDSERVWQVDEEGAIQRYKLFPGRKIHVISNQSVEDLANEVIKKSNRALYKIVKNVELEELARHFNAIEKELKFHGRKKLLASHRNTRPLNSLKDKLLLALNPAT